jgi:hypothetical protein
MTYAILKITSYCGISIGAIHFYGSVRSADYSKKYELTYKIEKKHHDMMNKLLDPRDWDKFDWPIGENTIRFFEREDVINAGIECFNKNFDPHVDILLHWNPVYIWNFTEDKALAGNKVLVERINSSTDNREIDRLIRQLEYL